MFIIFSTTKKESDFWVRYTMIWNTQRPDPGCTHSKPNTQWQRLTSQARTKPKTSKESSCTNLKLNANEESVKILNFKKIIDYNFFRTKITSFVGRRSRLNAEPNRTSKHAKRSRNAQAPPQRVLRSNSTLQEKGQKVNKSENQERGHWSSAELQTRWPRGLGPGQRLRRGSRPEFTSILHKSRRFRIAVKGQRHARFYLPVHPTSRRTSSGKRRRSASPSASCPVSRTSTDDTAQAFATTSTAKPPRLSADAEPTANRTTSAAAASWD